MQLQQLAAHHWAVAEHAWLCDQHQGEDDRGCVQLGRRAHLQLKGAAADCCCSQGQHAAAGVQPSVRRYMLRWMYSQKLEAIAEKEENCSSVEEFLG